MNRMYVDFLSRFAELFFFKKSWEPYSTSTNLTLILLLMVLLQVSIEEKLTNLKKEKRIIKEEIDRINPELHKVIFQL